MFATIRDQAQELLDLLDDIEIRMQRVKELWNSDDFPSKEEVEDLGSEMAKVAQTVDYIAENQPTDPNA